MEVHLLKIFDEVSVVEEEKGCFFADALVALIGGTHKLAISSFLDWLSTWSAPMIPTNSRLDAIRKYSRSPDSKYFSRPDCVLGNWG